MNMIENIFLDIISGDIELDFKGHSINKEDFSKGILKKYSEYKLILSDIEDINTDQTLFRKYKENGFITPDDFENKKHEDLISKLKLIVPFVDLNGNIRININGLSYCSKCNKEPKELVLNLFKKDVEVFSFEMIEPMTFEYTDDTKKNVKSVTNDGKWDFVPLPSCKVEDFDAISEIIDVDENLLFRNFFLTQDDEYFKELTGMSITNLAGRKKLSDLYAEENIFYGQTGNMTVYIYQKDNEVVILTDHVQYTLDELEEYDLSSVEIEQLHFYKSWDYKGSISCEVWRYMASSRSNLEKLNLKNDHYDSEVEVSLTSGKYEMRHNYRVKKMGLIVSKIKKV